MSGYHSSSLTAAPKSVVGSSTEATASSGGYDSVDRIYHQIYPDLPCSPRGRSIYSDETTTLLTGQQKYDAESHSSRWVILIVLLLSIVTPVVTIGAIRAGMPADDSIAKDRIRREWSREIAEHKRQARQWEEEGERMWKEKEDQDSKWAEERKSHQREEQAWGEEKRERDRKWAQESLSHQQEHRRWEEEQRDQDRKWAQERLSHQDERDKWNKEKQQEDNERAHERNEWEGERQRWADNVRRHQEEWEHWEKERNRVRWGEPQGDERCTAYETRFYTATLAYLPPSMHWMQACMETPIEIHGVRVDSPESCEKRGSNIVGRWKVNFDEPACRTYWETFSDTGCVSDGSRKRRIEARLENLRPEYDWVEMCATTPAEIRGTHYSGPTYCHPRSGWTGMTGIWEIDDESC